MATNGGNPAPAVPDAAIDYGSISKLLAHLELNLDPAEVFNVRAKLPHWLHRAKENQLVKVNVHTAPDPNFAAAVGSYWVKVSSASSFERALDDLLSIHHIHPNDDLPPVFLYVLPTIPLRDAHRIEEMEHGVL
ncbi:hypothetical protein PVAP13_3NG261901 [Panicum virgatum]|uniref:Uncharacterized protein n=1 Tax=Panicum virgatum TaxID=38727 RepID=A0A8T0UIX4_PANVG|nr:hypothetical protein PVAP13_3NG261901 [Panicum virgatum]